MPDLAQAGFTAITRMRAWKWKTLRKEDLTAPNDTPPAMRLLSSSMFARRRIETKPNIDGAKRGIRGPSLDNCSLTAQAGWRACQIRCSIVVSISACHAEDPGSIPGGGVFLSFKFLGRSKSKKAPTVGLEPTTTRLRALRSAD